MRPATSLHTTHRRPAASTLAGLVDQAVVSITSFVATVLVGRQAGESELGAYVLAFTVVILVTTAQDSIVTSPYTLFRRRDPSLRPERYAGGSLVHHGLFTASVVSALVALGFVTAGTASGDTLAVVIVLAIALPFALLKEFARRFSFAHHDLRAAVLVDVAAAVLQLGGLMWLGLFGRLTAATAIGTLGAAHGIVGMIWLVASRHRFEFDRGIGRSVFGRHWRFVRWDLPSRVVGVLQGYGVLWIVWLVTNGAASESVGVFAACLTIVQASNPVILGASNVLIPRLADARADSGSAEVWRVARKVTLGIGALLAMPAAILAIAGGSIVEMLYGSEFGGQHATVAILAPVILVWWAGVTATNALAALERSDVYLLTGMAALAVTVATGLPLTVVFGLPGAAVALATGSSLQAGVLWTLLRHRAAPRPSQSDR